MSKSSFFQRNFRRVFNQLNKRGMLNWVSSEAFLSMKYYALYGKKLNLRDPKTYSEKLQWLKLHDHNDRYPLLVDKYEVKPIVAEILGEECIIPTLGVWDSFDEIDFDKLPDQFVLKCTHDSGGLVICTDKSKLDKEKAKNKIDSCLKKNYFWSGREWPYLKVKPRVIAEKYMVDESGYELKDYKFFVFDGKMKAMFIATDRNAATDTCFDFFDRDFNHLPFTNGHPNASREIPKPPRYEEMIEMAEKLGAGLPQVRIDFYNINGDIYFGEITLYHWSGLKPFEPEEWDRKFGDWIQLPEMSK